MDSQSKIPFGWTEVKSKSHPGKVYFYNQKTKQSVWKLSEINSNLPTTNAKRKTPKKITEGVSIRSKPIVRKNLAEQRMKNLKNALEKEKIDELKGTIKQSSQDPAHQTSKVTKTPKKTTLSPRKRAAQRESVTEIESMEVDMPSSEELKLSDCVEPMEWEEMNEIEIAKEVLHIRSQSLKAAPSSLLPALELSGNVTVQNKLYIVVDTNVFCSNLKFIEKIKGKNFKGIGNACIYVPYIVLCELDMLKTRDGNISKTAQRAIKCINEYFQEKNGLVVGQNINDDTREIIPIDSNDDRILNCALQLKRLTKSVLILSNDINLRNKALVNEVEAFSCDTLNYADFNATNSIKL